MRVLQTYISGRYIKVFLTSLVVVTCTCFLVDILEKMDPITDHKIPAKDLLQYYLRMTPYYFLWFRIPALACLVSGLVVLGALQKNHELLAISASGVSLLSVLFPIYLVTLGICFLNLLINEIVVPRTFSHPTVISTYKKLSRDLSEKPEDWNFSHQDDEGKMYRVFHLNATEGRMDDVVYYETRRNATLIYRISAEHATWSPDKERWILHDAEEWLFDDSGEPLRRVYHEEVVSEITETPEDFLSRYSLPAQMSTMQLKRHIDQLKALNFDPLREELEMYAKLALPFSALPIMILGVPVILSACKRGTAAGLGACVVIVIVLFISNLAALPLGKSGTLTPFQAAFLPTFLACIVGVLLFFRIQR